MMFGRGRWIMVNRLARLLAVLGLLLAAAPSYARHRGTQLLNLATRCPNNATFLDEGCATAPVDGVFQVPTGRTRFFGQTSNGYINPLDAWTASASWPASLIGAGIARQTPGAGGNTSAPYAGALPPYDIAGVDFAVGYSQKAFCGSATCGLTTPGRSPALLNGVSGCVYETIGTGNGNGNNNDVNGPELFCNGSGVLDIEGYDFSGQTGPNGCVWFMVPSFSAYTSIILKNNKFGNGPGCSTSMLGKNDANGANPNPNSPGGSFITAYVGDIFKGYILANTSTLCVTATSATGAPDSQALQGTVEIGNGVNNWKYALFNDAALPSTSVLKDGTKFWITGPSAGDCTAGGGGTPYPLNNAIGAVALGNGAASPAVIYQRGFTFVVTSIKPGGIIGLNTGVQFDNNNLTPTLPAGLNPNKFPAAFRIGNANVTRFTPGDTIVACPGSCGTSSTGAYTLYSGPDTGNGSVFGEVTPPQNFTTGISVNALVDIEQVNVDVDFEQNYVDGDYVRYPKTFQSEFALLLDHGTPNSIHTTIIRNNAILRIPGRVFSTSAVSSYIDDNYWEGYVPNDNGFHTEIGIHGPPPGWGFSMEYINNTVLGTGDAAAEGTGVFFITGINSGNSVGPTGGQYNAFSDAATKIRYNTLIVNKHVATNDAVMGNGVVVFDNGWFNNAVVDHNYMDPVGTLSNICFARIGTMLNTQATQDGWLSNNTNIDMFDNVIPRHMGSSCGAGP